MKYATYHFDLFIDNYFICNHTLRSVILARLDSLADPSKFCSDQVKK